MKNPFRAIPLALAFSSLVFAGTASAAPGDLDARFGDGGLVRTNAGDPSFTDDAAVDGKGRTVTVGSTRIVESGSTDIQIARYAPDGSLDASFGNGGLIDVAAPVEGGSRYAVATRVLIDGRGRILVGGQSRGGAKPHPFLFLRLLPGGTPDPEFGENGLARVDPPLGDAGRLSALGIGERGRIYAAGTDGENIRPVALRLNGAGRLTRGWGRNGFVTLRKNADVSAGVVGRRGGLTLAGPLKVDPKRGQHLDLQAAAFRVSRKGRVNKGFGSRGYRPLPFGRNGGASAVALDRKGRIVVVGNRGGNSAIVIARLLGSGSLDRTFAGDGVRTIRFGAGDSAAAEVLVDSRDRIVVAGTTSFGGKSKSFAAARMKANGRLDRGFGHRGITTAQFPGIQATAFGATLGADGSITAVGRARGGEIALALWHG